MKNQYNPRQVAEHEASRWEAIDQQDLEACYEAHANYLQSKYNLPNEVARELTQIRMHAGIARVEHRNAAEELKLKKLDFEDEDSDEAVEFLELEQVISGAEKEVRVNLTNYYTRLQEEIKKNESD